MKLYHHSLSFSKDLVPPSISSMVRRGWYDVRLPALQTTSEMRATLLVSWWCTACALVVILVRVCGRYIRTEKLFREDKIMAASIIPLLIRMGFVHVILIWGTNNTVSDTLSAIDVQHREIGSKLVLASRISYAAFIWTAKLTVLEFLKRIVGGHWRKSYETCLQLIRYFLLATFGAVIVATLAECQPFDHYWQVIPDPGPQCRGGLAQLMTMGICDIISDVLLVVFPIPIVMMSTMTMKRKISLVLLFALSLALVAVTAYRIPSTIKRDGAQQYRSLLASLEILAAAGVSNSIVIGSFIRDRGAKKAKYRRDTTAGCSSIEETMTKRTAITQNHWGSDFDLAGDMGMCLAPELQSRKSSTTTAALNHAPPPTDSGLPGNDGNAGRSVEGDLSSLEYETDEARNAVEAVSPPPTPRKMSFFDVDNLIKSDDNPFSHQSVDGSTTLPNLSQRSSFRGSARSPASKQPTSQPQLYGPSPEDTRVSLADVGGLLSSTPPSTVLDHRTALPLAPAHRHPSSPCNLGRPASASRQPSRSRSKTPQPQPPPPSYRPRRRSETTQWNGASAPDLVDAGGLLR